MSEYVTVNIPQGKLRGKKVTSSANGVTYYSFQGIPYAKPPVGPLRFKPPEDPEPWTGTRDATKEGAVSVQNKMFSNELTGSEDCLFLNVFSSQLSAATPKAVMVWIHGGKFNGGSGGSDVYGPDYLVAGDVVLVTINYRLGAMGFLYLEDTDVTGNNGLRDQVMALRWVKKNIAQFGGDPGNVTIFGQSAGGACVHFLMLSPLASGLFHRAISQSGTAFIGGCNLPLDVTRMRARRVARLLGCTSDDPQGIVDFLRTVPPEKFIANKEKAKAGEELHLVLTDAFFPSYEAGPQAFLPASPRKLLEGGQFTKVPFIAGITSSEGKMFVLMGGRFDSRPMHLRQDFESLVPIDLTNEVGEEKRKEIANLMRKFYLGEKEPSEDTISQYVDVKSDYEFVFPLYRVVKEQVKWSTLPTYAYVFDHKSPHGSGPMGVSDDTPGVSHAGELKYLFHGMNKTGFPPGSPDAEVRDNMVKLWTNFAKTGIPTRDTLNITWTPVTTGKLRYLRVNGRFNLEADMFKRRIDFWEDLYKKYLPQ